MPVPVIRSRRLGFSSAGISPETLIGIARNPQSDARSVPAAGNPEGTVVASSC